MIDTFPIIFTQPYTDTIAASIAVIIVTHLIASDGIGNCTRNHLRLNSVLICFFPFESDVRFRALHVVFRLDRDETVHGSKTSVSYSC
ncbi:hypothetical protein GA004_13370 [Candidatus Pelagisphaera phototrophica]|nr:hypothetical protein [Candidatus Pelagisphaera phototrophica]QXD34008.1 hypothetical protein GA004_13370 [Candidatus Pelagisphaera phototrophica]